ncbi:type II restriction endonuclease [Flavobacterium psychrophilum]|uniref:type II restriction endonuclease n=1 Tax=Flavobacterium psychrophilum TaxID=96345 RepID=UPI001ABCC678|nr:type II restriction endonuclease [Flavobacterium psychrophilum]
MSKIDEIPVIIDIPKKELDKFDTLIKQYRTKYIRTSQEIVEFALAQNQEYLKQIKSKQVSKCISELREIVWQEYLLDEVNFNAILMRDLHKLLETPKDILEVLLNKNITDKKGEELIETVKEICGEYAGRVFPYIYRLSLSNTQSRRSRAGKSFEAIIYKIYENLGYEYDSQSKVGRKTFDTLGLGKKVDSILPNIKCYAERRNKTIIGTMKTSLRERWQEVAEEIERTKIPEIHLLTADESIPKSKAQEMANHNIIVVTYEWVANSVALKSMKNIISFEEYLFEEIPNILKFWNLNK